MVWVIQMYSEIESLRAGGAGEHWNVEWSGLQLQKGGLDIGPIRHSLNDMALVAFPLYICPLCLYSHRLR